ncbi:hypothetical protein [Cereibacter sphaeroides]|uniref:hypothetical protein n=1 Tax=Cereibacter sphaeroides TaxID=1063 RepID=UPI001F47D154|nr:hypothetical protein [Cereibacter sphaeroides]MCE6968051.1 hypothetical protein [Cereibacter sphaeroides]
MIVRRYRIDGDPNRALRDATATGWTVGPPVPSVGPPCCVLRFESEADQTLFALACPDICRPVEPFGLDLVIGIDVHFVWPVVGPILEQALMADRVKVCGLYDIGLPTAADHEALLSRLRATGWPADIY